MAIAIDTSATHSGTAAFNYTCTGTNLIIFVSFHWSSATASSATAVTYGGVAMTQLSTHQTNGSAQVDLWYLKAPATGANSIAWTNTGSSSVVTNVASYTGVDQTTPIDGSALANIQATFNSTTPVQFSFTTTNANELLVSAMSMSGSSVTTELSILSGTTRQGVAAGTGVGALGDRAAASSGANTFEWDRNQSTSRAGASIAVAINPAASVIVDASNDPAFYLKPPTFAPNNIKSIITDY